MAATDTNEVLSLPSAAIRGYFLSDDERDGFQFLHTHARPLLWALEQLQASHPAWLQNAAVRRMAIEFGSTAVGVVSICKRGVEPGRSHEGLLSVTECLAFFEQPRHLHLCDRYPLGLVALLRCLRAIDGRWYALGNEIYEMLRNEGDGHPYAPLIRLYVTMAIKYDVLLASRCDTPMSYAAC